MATYNAIKYNVDYGGFAGNIIPLATFTSDGSDSNATFTSGIDSSFDEYLFFWSNIHPETDTQSFDVQFDTGTNSNYNQTITSTVWRGYRNESGGNGATDYHSGEDQNNGTATQSVCEGVGGDNDQATDGWLRLYNPASGTFVKHFQAWAENSGYTNNAIQSFTSGYINTTTAITRVRFQFGSGEIQAGKIQMFGVH